MMCSFVYVSSAQAKQLAQFQTITSAHNTSSRFLVPDDDLIPSFDGFLDPTARAILRKIITLWFKVQSNLKNTKSRVMSYSEYDSIYFASANLLWLSSTNHADPTICDSKLVLLCRKSPLF